MFNFKGSSEQGFSLVELMIVVAIIGILAAVAVPRFQNFQAKAKQAEAKNNLSHIYTLQQAWYGDNDTYSADLNAIGFKIAGTKVRYGYATTGGGSFTATATASSNDIIVSGCGAADTWTINQDKKLVATVDCTTK